MRRGSLFLKYAIPLVILSSGAVIASGLVEMYFSYQESKAALARIQHEKAVAAAVRIEQFARDLEHQIAWIAQAPWGPRGVTLDQRRLDSLRLLRQVPAITEVSHLDLNGHEQLRVSRLAMDVVGSGLDFSHDPKFKEPLGRKTYFSPVYFRKESEPYITIALAGSGEDAGVIAAEANLKFIWDVVSNMKVGQGGHAYVVDANGRLIAHPDISLVLQNTDLSSLPLVRAAATKNSNEAAPVAAVTGRDVQGREVLSASAPIEPLGWTVFVDLPLKEAFAPLYSSLVRTGVLLLVGLAVSILASLVLVRRMVAPIHVLQTGAARIGAGALDQRIEVKTGDELQALGEEFNRMAERLQESYAGLERKVEERTRDLTEALEQQTATSEILRVISSSPTDLQPVLDAVAENAARLCDASDVLIQRVDGDASRVVAQYSTNRDQPFPFVERVPLRRDSVTGRAIIDRSVVHVPDLSAESEDEFAEAKTYAVRFGYHTILAVPMLREGAAIGVVCIRRVDVRPFSDKQIELLKTFADQAVIAIENVRLFKELEERNKALTEALQQQTATSEILRVISSSPTDTQPVFATILASATRLCEATFGVVFGVTGDRLFLAAHHNLSTRELAAFDLAYPQPLDGGSYSGRAVLTQSVIQHVHGVEADPAYPSALSELQREIGFRASLQVPMLKAERAIGVLTLWRRTVTPFTEQQVELLKTFADQAVIAIENVRLFKELEERNKSLTEALEQQTATSEILRVISSSPTDVQPVLDTIAESAARLCNASDADLVRVDGDYYKLAAHYGSIPTILSEERLPIRRDLVPGRAIIDRCVVHVADFLAESDVDFAGARTIAARFGYRTMLVAPMLREGTAIGAINIRRTEPRPFSDKQVELLRTFADQAVIAIENVRLFKELEERLDQQTATSEILRVISSSPTDLQPVLDAVAERAAKLCAANDAQVYLVDGDFVERFAGYGPLPMIAENERVRISRGLVTGRAILDRQPIHVHDSASDLETEFPDSKRIQELVGFRTMLVTPLLREGSAIGAILIRRMEVNPFSEKQIELVKTFADQAVIAIENVRLFKELQARTQELAHSVEQLHSLAGVSQAVNSTLDLDQVLSTIVAQAVQLSSADGGAVYEFNDATGEFRPRATYGFPQDLVNLLLATPLRIGEGATGRAAASRAPVEIADMRIEGAYTGPLQAATIRAGTRAVLAIPLLREARVLGGLVVSRNRVGVFGPEVVGLLQTFAAQSTLAIQNARLFREIEQKSHELQVASQHKSQFLANMSHELRTPLNAILGYTELIVDQIYGEVPEKIRDVLDRVQRSGRHLLGLINDVLDLSKIEAGQLTLSLSDYSFQDAVQSAVTSVESLAREKGLRLTVDVASKLPVGRGDERRIVQVLLNLVGNAIKFTDTGEVAVRVSAVDDAIRVSVSDTGPGIPEIQHERIFEEFQQVDGSSTRAKGGTGLGLAIAKKIIELHGGRIWVESVVGKGSTFTFSLPVRTERQEGTA